MRLVLSVRGTQLTFTPPTDTAGPYPWLAGVGTLREAAEAGDDSALGIGETPFLRVDLDNRERQAMRLIGRPLREPAEVYHDDGELFFAGLVADISIGQTVTLEIGT